MTVGGWIFIGYCVVALVFLRPLAGHIAWSPSNVREGRPDMAWGYFCAVPIAAAWPAVAACVLMSWRGPTFGAERAAQQRAQEERIRRLERELELTR